MDELIAAASVFAMEVDSEAGDGLGLDKDPIESGGSVLQERSEQPGAANGSGMDVDAASKAIGDAFNQVMNASSHTVSTPYRQPLASCGSTHFVP